jgi:hypothetical protein
MTTTTTRGIRRMSGGLKTKIDPKKLNDTSRESGGGEGGGGGGRKENEKVMAYSFRRERLTW